MIALLAAAVQAAPSRQPLPPRAPIAGPGRDPAVLVIKLVEDAGLLTDGPVVRGAPADLQALLGGSAPLFPRDPSAIRADRAAWDPERRLADLTLYRRLRTDDPDRGALLAAHPLVESVEFALSPQPPPADLSPSTPDFSGGQTYAGPAPDGLGFDAAVLWPGGTGEGVTIADIEYGWEEDHEDLGAAAGTHAWGLRSDSYAYHGTSVLGELIAGDNGYGVTGLVPDAAVLMISPFDDSGAYDVAAAIDGATALLEAGDVLLIEQQAWEDGGYCPVEISSAVFDAITLAVAKGISVVEPSGNGAQNLDDPKWDGWFDRAQRDSGAILVGGGSSPYSSHTPRTWTPRGSSYGSRIDVQGWYDGIVTTTNDDYGGSLADLFLPDGDGRQGYTSVFGGTSGASPMIVAAAAAANGVAKALWGTPWEPMDLRAALVATGTPPPEDDPWIGPQPDMRRFLRTWGAR